MEDAAERDEEETVRCRPCTRLMEGDWICSTGFRFCGVNAVPGPMARGSGLENASSFSRLLGVLAL